MLLNGTVYSPRVAYRTTRSRLYRGVCCLCSRPFVDTFPGKHCSARCAWEVAEAQRRDWRARARADSEQANSEDPFRKTK